MARKINKRDLIKMANDSRKKEGNQADYKELELQMLRRK